MNAINIETIFRAYDIRGIYGVTLTEDIVYNIGAAYATFLGETKTICLGRDTRLSGEKLLDAFLKGTQEHGCNVVKTGVVPIPILGFFTWRNNYDAGVYISASHNPPEYNGIRIRGADGAGFLDEKQKIKEIFLKKSFRTISSKQQKELKETTYDVNDLLNEYFDFVTEKIDVQRGLTLVVDPGNGSACDMLPLYEKLGHVAHGINMTFDGAFPGRGPNPNEKTTSQAGEQVRQTHADFAVAFDADADRGIILDNKGRFVPPEKIAVIIVKNSEKTGDVVASVDSSILLERELAGTGIRVIREKVGDVFIAQAVKKHHAVIGVERSGHFFLSSFHASDDPFVMSAKLSEILSNTRKSLSELADEIRDYPYISETINCPDTIKFKIMDILKNEVAAVSENGEVSLLDGIRIHTDSWMMLVRASNTEPILRMYIETSEDNLKELVHTYRTVILNVIKKHSNSG